MYALRYFVTDHFMMRQLPRSLNYTVPEPVAVSRCGANENRNGSKSMVEQISLTDGARSAVDLQCKGNFCALRFRDFPIESGGANFHTAVIA